MKKLIVLFSLLFLTSGLALATDSLILVFADGSKQIIQLNRPFSTIKSMHVNPNARTTVARPVSTTAAPVKRHGQFWGTWNTQFGTTEFYREGTRLTGYFKGGIIEGKLAKDGKSFEGYWKKGNSRNKIFFRFRGSLIDGKYVIGKGKTGLFRGKKIK